MDIMNIKIETNLPALRFDYAALRRWVEEIAAKYTDLVVREEDVVGIKKDMAELNKVAGHLDDARKAAVRQVSEPIKAFEDQIKELVGVIKGARESLDKQVKRYEEQAREQKRSEVLFMIEDLVSEHDVPGLRIDVEPSWLNKSRDLKDVKAEIEAKILAHLRAQREAAQLEQARKDRAVAIEQQCARLSQLHGITLPPSQFLRLNDLDVPLESALADIEQAYQTRVAAIQAEQLREPMETPRPAPVPPAPRVRQVAGAAPTMRRITVEITYPAEQEATVEAALNGLQIPNNGINVQIVNITPAQGAA